MSNAREARAIADEMKEVLVDRMASAHDTMTALALVTAEVLASCDMHEGKTIEDATVLFSRQVCDIYAVLTKDMRS